MSPGIPTFEQWKAAVDRVVARRSGLGCDDLPDCDYRQMYDDGMHHTDAAFEVLWNADFPFDDDDGDL